jgi:hypothetical protein
VKGLSFSGDGRFLVGYATTQISGANLGNTSPGSGTFGIPGKLLESTSETSLICWNLDKLTVIVQKMIEL